MPYSFTPSVDMGATNRASSVSSLNFYVQPPDTATNALFTVSVANVSGGTPVAGASITISFSSGTLVGTAVATTNFSGVAVFSNLSVPGPGTYTLTATDGSAQAVSRTFTVTASTTPAVTSLSTSSADVSGGTKVILTGYNLTGATAVFFGGTPVTSFTIDSSNQITAVVPAHAAGVVDLQVTTPAGTSPATAASQFSYVSSVTFVVTNTLASGPGSLDEALRSANSARSSAIITFDPTLFSVPQTITLTASLTFQNPTAAITLNGPAAAALTISGNRLAGETIQNVIVTSNSKVAIDHLTLTQRSAGTLTVSSGTFLQLGGAVEIVNGTTTISYSTISNSTAALGGGIGVAGGTLVIENSTITGNFTPSTVFGSGGGIHVRGGNVTVLSSHISQNVSNAQNGGAGGGIFVSAGSTTVLNSTITGNTAPVNGNGGGVRSNNGMISISNSTISGNAASIGGGVSARSTFANVTLNNNIVWSNSAPTGADVAGNTNGAGLTVNYNLIGNSSGFNVPVGSVGNILNVGLSPGILAPLADNGGPTKSIRPVFSSPSVGAAGHLSTLNASLSEGSDTFLAPNTIRFASASLPMRSSLPYFTVQIDAERMAVIGFTKGLTGPDTFTVVRGVEGTVAAAHASGAPIYVVSDQRGQLASYSAIPSLGMGAVQAILQAPTLSSIAPFSGPTFGGTSVVITGTNFVEGAAVKFGSNSSTNVVVNSSTQISAMSPTGTGVVDVTVVTVAGTSSLSAADQFTYVPPPVLVSTVVNGGDMYAIDAFGNAPTGLVGHNSIIGQLYVTFDIGVTLGTGAFRIDARPVNTSSSFGVTPPASPNLNVVGIIAEPDVNSLDPNGGYKGYRLRFTSNDSFGSSYYRTHDNTFGAGNVSTSLIDGYYFLNVIAANVYRGGATNGIPMAENKQFAFWTLFGSDSVASNSVVADPIPNPGASFVSASNADLSIFASAYTTDSESSPLKYNPNYDFDLDGFVSNADLSAFAMRYANGWIF